MYVEGAQKGSVPNEGSGTATSAGGKGGGRWLFTSHDPCDLTKLSRPGEVFKLLGFAPNAAVSFPSPGETPQFVHFKFEPMVRVVLRTSVITLRDRSPCSSYEACS